MPIRNMSLMHRDAVWGSGHPHFHRNAGVIPREGDLLEEDVRFAQHLQHLGWYEGALI